MYSIVDIKRQGNFSLWQRAENYLNICGIEYKVESLNGTKLKLVQDVSSSRSLAGTILKVMTYVSIVLPLIALVIRQCYRSQYSIELRNLTDKEWILEKDVQGWKQKNRHCIPITLEKTISELNQSPERADLTKVSSYLATSDSYLENLPTLIKITYLTLLEITRCPNQENIAQAQSLSRQLGSFYREKLNQEPRMRDHFKSELKTKGGRYGFRDIFDTICKKAPWDLIDTDHASLCFLLKHLRKQIKLKTRMDKIREKISQTGEFQNLDPTLLHEAIQCLGLTWFKQTEEILVNKAVNKTRGHFIPGFPNWSPIWIDRFGMGKLNLGSLKGDTLLSVRGRDLESYHIDLEHERGKYRHFFDLNINGLQDCSNTFEVLINASDAMYKLANSDPAFLQENRQLIRTHLDKLERELEENVLKKEMNRIRTSANSSTTPNSPDDYFHPVCRCIEGIEAIKGLIEDSEFTPISQEESSKSVILASDNQYGRPRFLSLDDTEDDQFFPGKLKLGDDLNVAFVKKEKLEEFRQKLMNYQLDQKIRLFSFDVLTLAQKIEGSLDSYLYDIVNVKKLDA